MGLIKKILFGAVISSLPLLANAQPNIKKLEKEGKISSVLDLRNLGHNYFMKRNGNSFMDESYNKLRELESIKNGNFYLENNGKRILSKGIISSNFSKENLEEIDTDKDFFISQEEISRAYLNELENSFREYASKKLSKGELTIYENGYAYSKYSKENLSLLTEIYRDYFGRSKEEFYSLISGEDKVITDKEVEDAAKALYQTIFKKD